MYILPVVACMYACGLCMNVCGPARQVVILSYSTAAPLCRAAMFGGVGQKISFFLQCKKNFKNVSPPSPWTLCAN